MEELIGVLSGVLVPILVLAGVVIRAVGAVRNANSNAQKPPSAGQPVQPMFHARPAPARTTAVPTLSGSAEPPRTAPPARQRTTLGNAPGEGSPKQWGSLEGTGASWSSLEGTGTRWGSLEGTTSAGMGMEHGPEKRLDMRLEAGRIDETLRATKRARHAFAPSRSTLVQGILYAEILGRPGGRRARR